MGKCIERGRIGEVVDEQKGVGGEVGTGPKGTVFLLAGGVGKVEMIRDTIYGAGYRVRVFDCGVISSKRTTVSVSMTEFHLEVWEHRSD